MHQFGSCFFEDIDPIFKILKVWLDQCRRFVGMRLFTGLRCLRYWVSQDNILQKGFGFSWINWSMLVYPDTEIKDSWARWRFHYFLNTWKYVSHISISLFFMTRANRMKIIISPCWDTPSSIWSIKITHKMLKKSSAIIYLRSSLTTSLIGLIRILSATGRTGCSAIRGHTRSCSLCQGLGFW